MRISEALALRRSDVDLDGGVMAVTSAKSGAVRLLPLHSSTVEALRRYAAERDRACPTARASTFFVSIRGTALCHGPVRVTFIQLATAVGIRTQAVRPRIHDLRHGFAVSCLLDWYRSGQDVAAHMPVLSAYLGHINPAGTYWYLSAVPELMRLAAGRLENVEEARS